MFVGLAATGAFAVLGSKTYKATALVDLNQISIAPFDSTKSSDASIDIATQAKTASSQVVAAAAAKLLTGNPSISQLQRDVSVSNPAGTTTLSLTFTATTRNGAAAGANAFAKAYLAHRKESADARRQALLDTLNKSAKSLRTQLSDINKSLAGADPTSASAQNNLTSRTLLTQQFSDLSQRQNALTGMSIDPGSVVSSASPQAAVAKPSRKLVVGGGLLVSFLLGLIAAFVRDFTDRRLRSAEQLERILGVGVVSTGLVENDANNKHAALDDAMYVLRNQVLNAMPDSPGVLLMIDCSVPAVAGSTGAQLAELLGNAGVRVQLVMVTDAFDSNGYSPTSPVTTRKQSASGGEVVTMWTRFTEPDNADELRSLYQLIDRARQQGMLSVLAMTGRPKRSTIVAMASIADDMMLVAQANYSRMAQIRRIAQDVINSGSGLFGGVLVRKHRFGQRGTRPLQSPDRVRDSQSIDPQERNSSLRSATAGAGDRWVGAESAVPPGNPGTVPVELRLTGPKREEVPAKAASQRNGAGYPAREADGVSASHD